MEFNHDHFHHSHSPNLAVSPSKCNFINIKLSSLPNLPCYEVPALEICLVILVYSSKSLVELYFFLLKVNDLFMNSENAFSCLSKYISSSVNSSSLNISC